MTSKRAWMIGCICFAAISAFQAIESISTGLGQYQLSVRDRLVTAQRDALFKIIQGAEPPIKAGQIQRAAEIAKLSPDRSAGSLRLSGIEFVLSGDDVKQVRSTSHP